MSLYCADLHIHTALSPCADDTMTPGEIVSAALARGLHMIAICDHNSAGNAASVRQAAGERLSVIPGMELTTAEEIHVLGLFPGVEEACGAADEAARTLPLLDGAARRFGKQLLMNASGEIVGEEPRMLSAATALDLGEAVQLIRHWGGLVIAAHVNRPSFSVFSQLGFWPSEVAFDAIELAQVRRNPPWQAQIEALALPVLYSSDSHFVEEIGKARTCLDMEQPTFMGLTEALRGLARGATIDA